MHVFVLEVRVGVLCLQGGRLEDRLAVFDLAHSEVRLVKFRKELAVARAGFVWICLPLEQWQSYLDTFAYFRIVTKSRLLLDLYGLWFHFFHIAFGRLLLRLLLLLLPSAAFIRIQFCFLFFLRLNFHLSFFLEFLHVGQLRPGVGW